MKLLVTGGAGYIGSCVGTVLVAQHHEVVVLDDLSTGFADAVPDGAEFVQGDITTAADVLGRGGFDGVLHFAAKSQVGESVAKPDLYWRTNVTGSMALLDAMRVHDVPRLVFSSTAATYGEPEAVPITEDARTKPTSPYGASKLAVDMMITDYAAAFGLGAVSLRYFNVGGALADRGERHDPESHLVPLVIDAATGARGRLQVFGDDWPTEDGTCVRDYVHINDLAAAHVLALAATTAGKHQIFNLGSGDGYSVLQMLSAVERVSGVPVPYDVTGRRAGDTARLVASSSKIRNELGWDPTFTIDDIVRDAWVFRTGKPTV
ncbi:MAG: UDP-glucose 4-epimerase [Frankiaceae bacterium]|nr:UDP-glucose 4-epimerase [Frankiaceae bacterium]